MWEDGTIWQGAGEGVLRLRACADCGKLCHPPLPMCPHCQSLRWELKVASGRASLLSWLVSVHPGVGSAEARTVVVVRLEEGVNFVSNLIGAPADALFAGMALQCCFPPSGDLVLPLFRLADAAS